MQLYIDVRTPGTPSLLALASPLVLVVALVLAVQALRFRLELHVFTVIGLMGCVILVTFYNPMHGTPLGVAAREELQVLYAPPPNVMRIVILVTLGLVIGTAVYRARRLVLRVAQEVEDAENLRRFLPGELGDRLSDAALDALRSPKHRDIFVLMVDLRDFTARTEREGAEDIAALLARFRGRVIDAAERHDGVVDKFVGDGAMVIFGMRTALTAAAQGAFAAFQDIAADPGPRIAAALHSGPALIGAFGDPRRLEFTALGQTVNVTSRLEDHAKEAGLHLAISAQAVEAGGLSHPDLQSYGAIHVRGVDAPVAVYGLPEARPSG